MAQLPRIGTWTMTCCVFLIVSLPCAAQSRESSIKIQDHLLGITSPRFPEMVRIPGATYLMGSPVKLKSSKDFRQVEKPQNQVMVKEFYIGRFLVTAEEFCHFLNDNGNQGYFVEKTGWIDWKTIKETGGCYMPQSAAERCPAYPVTWVGAKAYCEWLSDKLGCKFRLPTEAEWELAARGPELRKWPWGDDRPLEEYRRGKREKRFPWYNLPGYRWTYVPSDKHRPWMKAPVGSYPLGATPDGVYDMLGYYAGQWCEDMYDEHAYGKRAEQKTSTMPEEEPTLRVLRGMYQVKIDYRTYRPMFPILRLLIPGDAKFPQYTQGRSWSRKGGDPAKTGAIFRLAMGAPHSAKEAP